METKETHILSKGLAESMFRDTMGLRLNLDLNANFRPNRCGRDIKQLLLWFNRTYTAKNPTNDWPEVRSTLARFQQRLSHPLTRIQFYRTMRELFSACTKAEAQGIIAPYDKEHGITFDETAPYLRAREYCQTLCEAVRAYPWLFYKIMVFHLSTPQPYYEQDRE